MTKLLVIVNTARASNLFSQQFLDAYEDAIDQKIWAVQLPLLHRLLSNT